MPKSKIKMKTKRTPKPPDQHHKSKSGASSAVASVELGEPWPPWKSLGLLVGPRWCMKSFQN